MSRGDAGCRLRAMGYVKDRWIESMEPTEEPPMGHMKNLDIIIRQGGDEAVAAVSELLRQREDEIERLREELARVVAKPTHTPDVRS